MAINRKLFEQHVDENDPLTTLLKGHLWVERCINESLSLVAVVPNELPDRAPFATKLKIALAFGAIFPIFGPTLKALNGVRNKAAHQLEYEVTDEDVDTLVATFDMDVANVIKPSDSLAERLSAYFNVLIFTMETMNALRAYDKDNREVLELHSFLVALHISLGKTPEEADMIARAEADPPSPPGTGDIWPS